MYAAGLGTRQGASTSFDRGFRVEYQEQLRIIGIEPREAARRYRWLNIRNNSGQTAYVREDFVTYRGDTAQFNLPEDLYPHPMPMGKRSWVRGFNDADGIEGQNGLNTDEFAEHNGWDHEAPIGTPVHAGPKGGTVVQSFNCIKCGPQGASVSVNDPSVFSDAGWGFGYGHFIIVRYDHQDLPASTQRYFAQKGLGEAHAFVMYAHLQERHANINERLEPNQRFALSGNSGRSTGPHLHLEVRASTDANARWAAIGRTVTDPIVLFKR